MKIRPAEPADRDDWLRMRHDLWPLPPGENEGNHAEDIDAYFAGFRSGLILVADMEPGIVGFLELGSRDYAEGCGSSPVAYVEGWWVDEEHRASGVGRALIEAACDWARDEDFSEIASDAEWDNEGSQAAHLAVGFEEADRVVCFRKTL